MGFIHQIPAQSRLTGSHFHTQKKNRPFGRLFLLLLNLLVDYVLAERWIVLLELNLALNLLLILAAEVHVVRLR